MERDFRPRGFAAPVKVGDEFEVKIEAVGEKGDGIAKKDGFVLFIPNAKEGDEVKIKVTRVLRRVGFAEIVGEGSAPSGESQSNDSGSDSAEEELPQDTENFGEDPQ
ncbi:MAG: TRAM domain-containing protein [Nanoarchaeota archaeon]|nr:TRAM domain-containing protein [Nanoarchaeota archaeon]MBU1005050.1 TRAM domain-containing protein [Nanoarchaeota archaeon]MBU1946563.1 TRAM domain-containing protein [Nanoarchaeota archaeon]